MLTDLHCFIPVLLAFVLLGVLWSDMKHLRIPNSLCAMVGLLALAQWAVVSDFSGAVAGRQLALFAAVSLALVGAFALNLLGGGDVKLLSVLALWFAPGVYVELLALTGLLGGLVAIIVLMLRRRATTASPDSPDMSSPDISGPDISGAPAKKFVVPYGVAISLAALIELGVRDISCFVPPLGS